MIIPFALVLTVAAVLAAAAPAAPKPSSGERPPDCLGLLDLQWDESGGAASLDVFEGPDGALKLGTLSAKGGRFEGEGGSCVWQDERESPQNPEACVFTPHLQAEGTPVRVLESRGGRWFRVALGRRGTRPVWIQAGLGREFFGIEVLLKDQENQSPYPSPTWDWRLFASPGGVGRRLRRGTESWLRVLETRRVADRLWVRAELMSGDRCEAGKSKRLGAGWLPYSDARGEAAIWLSDHGCGE